MKQEENTKRDLKESKEGKKEGRKAQCGRQGRKKEGRCYEKKGRV